jgi:hypothetical protein
MTQKTCNAIKRKRKNLGDISDADGKTSVEKEA